MNEIYRITGLNGWQLIAVIAACVAWCIAFWPHKIPGSNSTLKEKKKMGIILHSYLCEMNGKGVETKTAHK